jgi:DNA-binding NarL/FixJ family response regulator
MLAAGEPAPGQGEACRDQHLQLLKHFRQRRRPGASSTSGASSTASDPDGRPISVLIVDDQRLVRAGFRVILASEPGIVVVGEAADGLQAIELARALSPAVVLMDIRMPNMDGLAAARRVIDSGDSRVLILTTFDADEYVYETLRMGASGFLLKDAPPDQLVAAVRCGAAGDALIDPSITRRLIGRFAHAARPAALQPAQLKELTQRELDVLRLVAREIDTRYSARTPAGEYVHFRTSGVRSGPPEVLDALLRGEPVDPSAYYFRLAVYLETSPRDWPPSSDRSSSRPRSGGRTACASRPTESPDQTVRVRRGEDLAADGP